MSRIITITLILILVASTIILVQSATAEISRPSIPEFTIRQVDRSYDVETSYSTNHYTGETITRLGYHVRNLTIEITIKNQPFTSTTVGGNATGLFYNVQGKGVSEDWANDPYPRSDDHNAYAVEASTSDYTVVTFLADPEGWSGHMGPVTEFRVQAVVGYSYLVWSLGGGVLPIGSQFRLLAAGSWSNTQTITVGSGEITVAPPTASPSPTPVQPTPTPSETNGYIDQNGNFNPATPTPTQQPQELTATPTQPDTRSDAELILSWEQIAIIVLCALVTILAVALVVLHKRKV